MSIVQGYCNSFKTQVLNGQHNFSSNTFKIALYLESAQLSPLTTAYTSSGEVSASGYTAGGAILVKVVPTLVGNTAVVDFNDVTWSSTLTARGALIYNVSVSNAAVCVLDFGMNRTSQSGVFAVRFPPPTSTEAIIRL